MAALAALATPSAAQDTLTQDEALRLAFPPPLSVERRTAFLSEEELGRARALAGRNVEIERSVVNYYVGMDGGRVSGYAYFDAHVVRTLPEVLMVVVTPAGAISRVEILRFSEPPEYRAPEGWLETFGGHTLTDALSVKRDIVNMTGATLTSRAVTRAARRVLALHRVVREREEAP
ncbi:MAG: FMN-binding protein [Gemmatimonadales bacterium]|jgi:hypothetical protein